MLRLTAQTLIEPLCAAVSSLTKSISPTKDGFLEVLTERADFFEEG